MIRFVDTKRGRENGRERERERERGVRVVRKRRHPED